MRSLVKYSVERGLHTDAEAAPILQAVREHDKRGAYAARLTRACAGAALVVLAGALPVRGADGQFALVALSTEQTIPDARRYGAIVANGPGFPGMHFAPFPRQRDLLEGRYRVVGEANIVGAATTYVPPEPKNAPAITIGQPFMRVGLTGTGEISPTTDVVRLTEIDAQRKPRRLTFTAPNGASFALDTDADITQLSGLRPIETDSSSLLAQATFSGRDEWTLGTVVLHCLRAPNISIDVDGGTRVRIEGITRVANIPSFHAIGQQNAWGRESESSFWTIDPLVVVVRVPNLRRVAMTSSAVSGGPEIPLNPPPGIGRPTNTRAGRGPLGGGELAATPLIACSVGTNDLSDMWELERTFTTVAPEAHRSWASSVLREVTSGHISVGMPREAVAYIAGYPTAYGTKNEMNRQTDWTYSLPAPFSFSVTFDRKGRVSSYQPPGDLP